MTSLNKEGELIKQVKKSKMDTYVDNFVDGSKTHIDRDIVGIEKGRKLKFAFNKQYKDGSTEGLLITYMIEQKKGPLVESIRSPCLELRIVGSMKKINYIKPFFTSLNNYRLR